MIRKFRKKPVVIEAVQFIPENEKTLKEFCGEKIEIMVGGEHHPNKGEILFATIKTLEGDMTANINDWIIKGVKGEFYPIKNDIFLATYEIAE